MAIRNNEGFSVQLVPTQLGPITDIAGSLTGDTLNVVSPSFRGPAFVPQNMSNNSDVINLVGTERQNLYGHLYDQLHYYVPNQGIDTLRIWFDNGGSNAVHTRILGIGNGIKNPTTGKYDNAGFKISENQGMHFVFSTLDGTTLEDENYLTELGLDTSVTNHFLSHVTFTPENVNVSLTDNDAFTNKIKLKFEKADAEKFSYDFLSSLYNRKPVNNNTKEKDNLFSTEFESDFHYHYAKFAHKPIITGRINVIKKTVSGAEENVDYKDFEEIYKTAKTPWITSQPLDRSTLTDNRADIHEHVINLFRFWSLDDGEIGNRYKIKLNLKSRGDHKLSLDDYSKFDIYIFEYDARNNQFTLLETYEDLTLDANSSDYICRRIGTRHTFYDVETKKIYIDGKYDNVSRHLRVEINQQIENKKISKIQSILPSGFRAYPHIDCSKLENFNNNNLHSFPVRFYRSYNDVSEIDGLRNTWGVQMYNVFEDGTSNPSITINDNIIFQDKQEDLVSPHYYHTKFFNSDTWIEDDSYLNNFFHLEKICYKFDFSLSKYKDSGLNSSLPVSYDYLNLDKIDFQDFIYQLSFDLFTYGGFDGTNILNFDKKYMTNKGLMTEYYNNSITSILDSYKSGIDQITKYENCNGTILTVPDTSTELINRYCIEKAEELTRYIFIGDIKDYSIDINETVTSEDLSDYYIIEKVFANYNKDDIETLPYKLDKTENKLVNFINNQTFNTFDSKHYFTTFGDFSIASELFSKYISPVTFVTGVLATPNSLSISTIGRSPIITSNISTITDFSFNNSIKLNLNNNFVDNNSEKIKKILFRLNVNAFINNGGLNRTSPGLLTAHTHSGSEFSINRRLNIVRTVQLIKNSIMVDLYTNTSIIPDTVLFNNSSSINSIYQKINIQLTLLMQTFIDRGLISDFKINIDPNYINNNFNDIVNYKLKGNIIIQFGQSNIIELDLDNVLSELSESLSGDNNEVELPRVI